jgi:hypothetical protein
MRHLHVTFDTSYRHKDKQAHPNTPHAHHNPISHVSPATTIQHYTSNTIPKVAELVTGAVLNTTVVLVTTKDDTNINANMNHLFTLSSPFEQVYYATHST